MFCLSEIALAFHHLLCRDEVHMKSQWLWIHLLLLFSTDDWLEQWNVCIFWRSHSPPPVSALIPLPLHFALKIVASGACMKMTSLTLYIRMCHSEIWILPTEFPPTQYPVSVLCAQENKCMTGETGRSRTQGYSSRDVVFIQFPY